MLDELITHLLELIWAGSCVELARGSVVRSLSLSLPINLLNLFICLSLTLENLDSLTLLMKSVHFSIVVDVTKDTNPDLHLSSLTILSWRMLLIGLTILE